MRARHRRRIHLALATTWLLGGGALCLLYPTSLWWIVFMSWFANVYSCISAWAAETPVEAEESSTDGLPLEQEHAEFRLSGAGGACGCRVE